MPISLDNPVPGLEGFRISWINVEAQAGQRRERTQWASEYCQVQLSTSRTWLVLEVCTSAGPLGLLYLEPEPIPDSSWSLGCAGFLSVHILPILRLPKYHIVLHLFLVLPYREPMTATIYCPLCIDLLSVALPSQDRPRDKMICLWSVQ